MLIFTLGSIETLLIAISLIGFALVVFIDGKLRKPKFAKDSNDGLLQHRCPKTEG